MKNYRILSNKLVDDLASEVQIAINDGWEMVGPVFIYESRFDGRPMFNQPIIKITADRPSVPGDKT